MYGAGCQIKNNNVTGRRNGFVCLFGLAHTYVMKLTSLVFSVDIFFPKVSANGFVWITSVTL